MKNKIVVATGTSHHKTEFAVGFIKDYCKKRKIDAEVKGVNVYEADFNALDPTVIVLIGPNNIKVNRPVVLGTAFVTKIGMEEVCEKIIGYLTK